MGRRTRATATTAVLLGVFLADAGPARAMEPVIDIGGARLRHDGSLAVTVHVTCDRGLQPLEAHLTVTQPELVGGTAGLGRVRCTGREQRLRVVLVPVEGQSASFHSGPAHASAFLLLLDPATGTTVQAQDVEQLVLG